MNFNSELQDVPPYEPGKPLELLIREYGLRPEEIIKLGSNENPYGASPLVMEAIAEELHRVSQYPDDSYADLKQGLARKYGVIPENIIPACGSDQVLEFAARTVLRPGTAVLLNRATFAMYRIYSQLCGAQVMVTDTIEHRMDAFYELYARNAEQQKTGAAPIRMIFLCVPCNPIGDCPPATEVFAFIRRINALTSQAETPMILVDAAYMDFARVRDTQREIKPAELLAEFSNVLYTGTFSKSYGLGGMRVGYGIGPEEMIGWMYRLRSPFNLTNLTYLAAVKALQDESFVQKCGESNFSEMRRYEELFQKLDYDYFDSYTNFITVKIHNRSAREICDNLLRKGIIVRDLTSYGLEALRITIGRPEQNDRVLAELSAIL
ncbi:MAG: histidinol-phosphate transaminase [Leptospiraceae bacterium]|nr:histidinol-phosphate transaminase [Leptospiraceae bacterium]